jgi:hypothetical protein
MHVRKRTNLGLGICDDENCFVLDIRLSEDPDREEAILRNTAFASLINFVLIVCIVNRPVVLTVCGC